jgi:hypothetical protein
VTNFARTTAYCLATGLSLPTVAAGSGLARCAAIAEDRARLVCYDHLAGRAAPDGAAAPGTEAAPAPEAANAAAPAPATTDRKFGLPVAQQHVANQGPTMMQAHVTQVIVNQNQRGYLVLDNGQTWAITDGELLVDAGEAVTVRQAALGSFILTSESKHSYHVRRVR